MPIDWETAYDNVAAVPGARSLPGRWAAAATAFRDALGPRARRLAQGEHPRAVTDLFLPEGTARGLAVFVHGGYWMRNAPDMFSHLAAGPLSRGWAVAMPGYALCPEATVPEIVGQTAAGIAAAAAEVAGPLRLSGHSAGGHLAARMVCPGALPKAVLARVEGLVPISGLHDLRPLMRTPLQATLGLDLASARAQSPALLEPALVLPVTAWVGAAELTELRRQSALLATVWGGLGLPARLVEDPGQDHFTVIEALAERDSPLTEALVGG